MLNRERIYVKAIARYGAMSQQIVAMEEMSELIKELSKAIRGKNNAEKILEEVADVSIMLEQIKLMFGITNKALDEEIEFKLVRLNDRLNGND